MALTTTLKVLGIKTVAVAGTPISVFSAPFPKVTSVSIRALSTNTGVVYVGDSNVSASGDLGLKLQPSFDIVIQAYGGGIVNIDSLKIDATVNNSAVSVSYLEL